MSPADLLPDHDGLTVTDITITTNSIAAADRTGHAALLGRGAFALAECRRRQADPPAKNHGHVPEIIEPRPLGDRGDFEVGLGQQALGAGQLGPPDLLGQPAAQHLAEPPLQ
jgi:hypothetical protein